MKYRIAVCDDNEQILREESSVIKELMAEKNISYLLDEYVSPEALIAEEHSYDIVFLDIEMGDVSGIDAGRKLQQNNKDICIFFITNYGEYIDNAFDIRAHRFLTKPVDRERLSNGIDSAIKRIEGNRKTIVLFDRAYKAERKVKVRDIIYIENTCRGTRIYTAGGDQFDTDDIFSKIKEKIDRESDCFAPPHQSFYVNMMYVESYDKNNVIASCSGNWYKIDVSRREYKEFNKRMFDRIKTI